MGKYIFLKNYEARITSINGEDNRGAKPFYFKKGDIINGVLNKSIVPSKEGKKDFSSVRFEQKEGSKYALIDIPFGTDSPIESYDNKSSQKIDSTKKVYQLGNFGLLVIIGIFSLAIFGGYKLLKK
jgi:hypothetical protein